MRFPSIVDTSLHGSFFPEDVYPGENVYALITRIGSEELSQPVRIRIWRVSPLGVELLKTKENTCTLPSGSLVGLTVFMGVSSAEVEGVVVEVVSNEQLDALIAVRIITTDSNDSHAETERRRVRRWICHDMYLPTCVWRHPARFNEYVFSRVRDVSSGGARLVTSMRNKFLVRGMTFSANFNFPLIGQFEARLQISNLSVTTEMGKDYLSIGVVFMDVGALGRDTIAQYLNQFCAEATPAQLIRSGLAPGSVSRGVSYSYVRTEEEYKSVLELRRFGYVANKKVPEQTTALEMGSALDARARIVIGRRNGQVVATAALVFHEYHDRMEIEEDVEWPAHFPRKENCVEVIRLCTHSSVRGTDVLLSLFHFIGLTVAQSGREYIVFGATDGLLPVYRKLGMPPTEVTYHHKKLMGLMHTIVVANVAHVMAGNTMGPIYWNVVWRDVARYLLENGALKLGKTDRLRLAIYELFRPLAFILMRRKNFPRI